MTGPEHYREAERLLASYNRPVVLKWSDKQVADAAKINLAEAQVHATLALAAATAHPAIEGYVGSNDDARAWTNVTAPSNAAPS